MPIQYHYLLYLFWRYVDFNEPCECTGAVENWLNKLLDAMRATVRHEMTEGVVTYEEKPREQWIFDYPAQVNLDGNKIGLSNEFSKNYITAIQVALTGTQIWWTTEVNIAFARLEEGFESALKDYYKKQVDLWSFETVTGLNIYTDVFFGIGQPIEHFDQYVSR